MVKKLADRVVYRPTNIAKGAAFHAKRRASGASADLTVVTHLYASDRLIGFIRRVLRALVNRGRRLVWVTAQIIYHAIPMPTETKRAIARRLMPAPPEVAAPIEIDFSAAVPFGYAPAPDNPRLAVICHIFYDTLAPEFRRYLRNIPFPFDLFISTDDDAKKTSIEGSFANFAPGRVEVRIAPNRGRDIAPKLVAFADVYPRYDFVLHLHSKASKHAEVLELWRVFLFENLLGSPEIVRSVFDAFARRPDLGIVASQHFEPVRHWISWGGNFKATSRLAQRLGIPLLADRLLDFPSGSMFWARTEALKPLLDLHLQFAEFDIESSQVDNTLAHAIERLYFHVCEHAGYRWMKIAHPPLFAVTPAIMSIETSEALDRFLSEYARELLGDNLPSPRKAHLKGVLAAPGLVAKVQAQAQGRAEAIDPKMRVVIGLCGSSSNDSAQSSLAAAGVFGRVVTLAPDVAAQNDAIRKAFDADADIFILARADGAFAPATVAAFLRMMQVHERRALIGAPFVGFDRTTMSASWVSAACMAIPRAVFAATDGFDVALGTCADVDLSWRARALGFGVFVCADAAFQRNAGGTAEADLVGGALLLARKWGDAGVARRCAKRLGKLRIPLPAVDAAAVPDSWRRFAAFGRDVPGLAR